MPDKTTLLASLRAAIANGTITRQDIDKLFHTDQDPETAEKSHLSAVDVMFHIAGVMLYAALLSVIAQTWDDNSAILRIILSVGMASILWSLAYYLIKYGPQTDVRQGLTSALLLTGSLTSITGGYIVINEILGGYGDVNFFAGAVALLATGAIHIAFDRTIRKNVVLLVGVLLCVMSVPATLFGIIQHTDPTVDVWCAILVFSAGLLAYATRVVSRLYDGTRTSPGVFDSLAALVGLGAMYVGTYGDYSFVWFVLLVASILGIFYASVVLQNKHLLGSASFFLVISIITISFKYFSGFGVSTSLVLATLGLLGSAAAASSIHKRYFK